MKSRLLINALLLILIAVVGFFAISTDNNKTDSPQTLSTITTELITNISIRHNQRIVTIEKNESHWQLTAPINIPANDFRIGTVLKLLNTASHARYVAKTLDLNKFGLQTPDTSITLNEHNIDFGIANPINNYRYVKLNNEVHLIDDHFYPLITSQIGTLAARTLLPPNTRISKMILPEQTLALDFDIKWFSTKAISADAITETLEHWKNTEAFGVHDYKERMPLETIEVFTWGNDEPIVFLITDVDPWLIIARPDIKLEYHFNLEFYDSLLRPGAAKELPDEFSRETESETLQPAPLQPL